MQFNKLAVMLVSITCLFYKCIVQYVSYTACTSKQSKVLSYYFHKLERYQNMLMKKYSTGHLRQLACYRKITCLVCTVSVGDLPACPVQYGELEAAGMLQENNMP
jgi:hypothetical protein